jgi:hypothetical protein
MKAALPVNAYKFLLSGSGFVFPLLSTVEAQPRPAAP